MDGSMVFEAMCQEKEMLILFFLFLTPPFPFPLLPSFPLFLPNLDVSRIAVRDIRNDNNISPSLFLFSSPSSAIFLKPSEVVRSSAAPAPRLAHNFSPIACCNCKEIKAAEP